MGNLLDADSGGVNAGLGSGRAGKRPGDVWRWSGNFSVRGESGGEPPHSRTLAPYPNAPEPREAFWNAPAPWRFSSAEPSGRYKPAAFWAWCG